jgi:hypothetical protein
MDVKLIVWRGAWQQPEFHRIETGTAVNKLQMIFLICFKCNIVEFLARQQIWTRNLMENVDLETLPPLISLFIDLRNVQNA